MKVSLSIEVTDTQRNALAQAEDGKPVKRLATRDEVRDFVEGCISALAAPEVDPPEPTSKAASVSPAPARSRFWDTLTAPESKVAKQLRAQGKDDGYIRGWIIGGRLLKKA